MTMPGPVRWTAAMVDDFIAWLNQGEDLAACARLLTERHGVAVSRGVASRKLVKLRGTARRDEVPPVAVLGHAPWTPPERGRLLQLVDEQGRTVEQAAAEIGRLVGATRKELERIRQGEGIVVGPWRFMARMRHCLTCGAGFVSEGPHHRMCDGCRTGSSGGIAAEGVVQLAGLDLGAWL